MAKNFVNVSAGMRILPQDGSNFPTLGGEMMVDVNSGKLEFFNASVSLMSPMVTEEHPATLTNKTLVDPIISGSVSTITVGSLTLGSGNNAITVQPGTNPAPRTVTFPSFTTSDTLVTEDSVSTLTEKTIDADENQISNIRNNNMASDADLDVAYIQAKSGSVVNYNIVGTDPNNAQRGTIFDLTPVAATDPLTWSGVIVTENADYRPLNVDYLPKALGGTGQDNTALVFPGTGTVVTSDSVVSLTNKTFGDAISLTQIAAPSSPPANTLKLYSKTGDGLYIKNSAGTELQVATSTPGYPSVITPSSSVTLTTNDQIVLADANGAAFTITLPSASVSLTGKTYNIKKTDSTFNAVTISGTSLSTTLNTQNEELIALCTGSAWIVTSRNIPNGWIDYTATYQNCGSVSVALCKYRRIGNSIDVTGRGTCSNPVGGALTITLPSTLLPTDYAPGTMIYMAGGGMFTDYSGGTQAGIFPIVIGGENALRWGMNNSRSGFNPLNANSIMVNGNTMAWSALGIQIQGWNG